MTALVLGGNGFIGSHLTDALVSSGESVRVFDRGPESFRQPLEKVEYFFGDFSDTALLAEALTSVDVVYHLISTTVPSTSNLDPVNDINSNLVNTVRLLELMNKQNVPRIVYMSSGGTVYGVPDHSPITEEHSLRPISSYGIVKVAIEKYLYMFKRLHGIEFVALRASNPFGPRQGHMGVQGVIGTFLQRIHHQKGLEVWGDGSVVRDYIYISDLIELTVKAGRSSESGVFNAGSGTGSSVQDVINAIKAVVEKDVIVEFKEARSFDVPHAVLDIAKAAERFNWKPKEQLDSGIRKSWDWVRSH